MVSCPFPLYTHYISHRQVGQSEVDRIMSPRLKGRRTYCFGTDSVGLGVTDGVDIDSGLYSNVNL